ncbi:agmatinase [Mycoplasmatota bacterium]|nr:agmatinase [Mycoplasmatota bacterium]
MKVNKLTFISCDANYSDSNIVIFGAPYDGTTSFRPGTRFAPNMIRIDSEGLETYSPYLDIDIDDKKIIDIGDIEFPFGNLKKTLDTIYKTSSRILNDNKKPLMIGGEHLVTLPQVSAVVEKYSDLHIIHLDAHADLRNDYIGESLSHATVMRRIFDLVGKNKIYQYGIRSGTKEEFAFASNNTIMNKFIITNLKDDLKKLKDKSLYLTIDLDLLDPSIFPGTGTPEPGGITFNELLEALQALKGMNIVGCDVVELSPHYDNSGVSTAVASKVIREILCLL